MADLSDREIAEVFTQAERYAKETSFPETSEGATNENLLNPSAAFWIDGAPPKPKDPPAEEAASTAKPSENAPQTEAAQPAPVPEKPATSPASSEDGMMTQDEIEQMVASSKVTPPAPASEPEPADSMMSQDDIEKMLAEATQVTAVAKPDESVPVPQPLPQVVTPASEIKAEPGEDSLMNQDDIEALILAASADKPATPQIETAPEPETSLLPDTEPEEDSLMNQDDIEALIQQNSTSSAQPVSMSMEFTDENASLGDGLMASSDIEKLLSEMNAGKPSDSSMDEVEQMFQTMKPEPDPEPSQISSVISQDDIQALMGKKVAKPASGASTNEIADDESSIDLLAAVTAPSASPGSAPKIDLDALLGQTDRVSDALNTMDTMARKAEPRRQLDTLNDRYQPKSPRSSKFAIFALTIFMLAFLGGGSYFGYRLYQGMQQEYKLPIASWKWQKNPKDGSVRARFEVSGPLSLKGVLSRLDAEARLSPDEIVARIKEYYTGRFAEKSIFLDRQKIGDKGFYLDYVYPDEENSAWFVKRSLFLNLEPHTYQIDFVGPAANLDLAKSRKSETWQHLVQQFQNGMGLEENNFTELDKLTEILVQKSN